MAKKKKKLKKIKKKKPKKVKKLKKVRKVKPKVRKVKKVKPKKTKKIKKQVKKKAVKKIEKPKKVEKVILTPWDSIKEEVQNSLDTALKKLKYKANPKEIANSIEEPPSAKMGDLACSISFVLGKKKRKSPREIAEKLVKAVRKPSVVSKVALAGAYVNFFLKRDAFAKKIITEASKDDYGKGTEKKDKIMVEYSQPNTHKAFHIGHIRGTSLGESLSRILSYNGYEVVQANYMGDVGMHVAKCLWNYLKFHKDEAPSEHRGTWLGEIYAEACRKIDENPDYKEEADEILKKLETGDEELTRIWEETRKWSLDEFDEIYKELDARFDHSFYESEVEKRGKELVKELQKRKIANKSQGAVIINLKKQGLDDYLLLKSDGTSLYSTKDLALAEEKFKKYEIDRSVYVVGSEQRLYFQQLFATLQKMGFKQAKKCFHLAFDLVTLKSGKMSSREGTAILYTELRDKMVNKALEEVVKRNPELDPRTQRDIAMQITIGAMKFSMLNISNNKTIFFEWDKTLEFEGETGPYIQYASVRAKRMLEKAKKVPDIDKIDFNLLETEEEHKLIKYLAKFPNIVMEVSEEYKPHILANYAYTLAEKFNTFYNANPVLSSNIDLRDARLSLVNATYKTLCVCLTLLGMKVPDRM